MSVLDQAQNFSGGVVAAARQRDRWARKEANATDEETREQYREAIADLEARYPDIADVPIGGAEAFARDRGHGTGTRSPVHEGRRRRRAGGGGGDRPKGKSTTEKGGLGGDSRAARSKPGSTPGITPGARRSAAQRAAAAGRPTPRVDRAIRETGIPAALDSGGSLLMGTLGATIGLAFTYFVLSSAENPKSGISAIDTLIGKNGWVPRALWRFLSSEKDIFPGRGGGHWGQGEGRFEGPAPSAKSVQEHEGRLPQPGIPAGPRNSRGRAGKAASRLHPAGW